MKYLKYTVTALGILLASIYLTWLIDQVTLNNWIERCLACVGAIIVLSLCVSVYSRFCNKNHVQQGIRWGIPILAAIVIVVFFHNDLIPRNYSASLTLRAIPSSDGIGREAWLTTVQIDDSTIDLSKLPVINNLGWEYVSANDDFVCYNAELENSLTFRIPECQELSLGMISSSWCGDVEVIYGDQQFFYTLYNIEQNNAVTNSFSLDTALLPYISWPYMILLLGLAALCISIFSVFVTLCIVFRPYITFQIQIICMFFRQRKYFLPLLLIFIGGAISFFPYISSLFLVEIPSSLTITNCGRTEESKGSEIWLKVKVNDYYLAGEEILENSNSQNWELKDGWLLSTTIGDSLSLQFSSPINIQLEFQQHKYTGAVAVSWNGDLSQYKLYSNISQIMELPAQWNVKNLYDLTKICLYAIVVFLLFIISGTMIDLLHLNGWRFVYWLNCILLNYIVFCQDMFCVEWLCIVVISAFTIICWRSLTKKALLSEYIHGGKLIALICITLYSAFALAGDQLFLLNVRMTCNARTLSIYFMIAGMLFPVGYFVLFIFELLHRKLFSNTKQHFIKQIWCIRLICFLIISSILLLISYGFYPGNLSPDGVDHWNQAIGAYELNDGHPIIFVLILRLLSKIVNTPFVGIIFQVVFFAWVVSDVCSYLYERGAPFIAVTSVAVFSAIMPGNYMVLTNLSKNPVFAILNLWVLILVIRLISDPIRCLSKTSWYIQTTLALSLLYLIRYNAFPAVIAVALFLVVVTIKYFKTIRFKAIVPVVTSVMVVFIIQGPLYSCYDITKRPSSIMGPLMTPYASALSQQLEIPEEDLNKLNEVLELDAWAERYDPYNRDPFNFTLPRPNYSALSTLDGVRLYLSLFIRYPDVVIKDRLQGADFLWNLFQSNQVGSYNHRYLVGVFETFDKELLPDKLRSTLPNSNSCYYMPNSISSLCVSLAEWTSNNLLIDMFMWRDGIYIILLCLLFLYLSGRQKGILIWALIPTLLSMGTLLLYVSFQLSIYGWFFSLASIFGILSSLAPLTEESFAEFKEV